MQVRKRDGTTQTFDLIKIQRAIAAAMDEVGEVGSAQEASERVIERLGSQESVSIEFIQDCVEEQLMEDHPNVARAYILYREERREARAERPHPDAGALADYIHAAKYARWDPSLLRRETYEETVLRSMRMHQDRWPELHEEICSAFQFVLSKKVLPSMRSMQFGGPAVIQHNARLYNCSFTHLDRINAFSNGLYMLLCGSGVGYSVQQRHVGRLPVIKVIDRTQVSHFIIPDSIEGWAEALRRLLIGHMETGRWVEFAYHKIRREASPLSSGGKAPGHLPLRVVLETVREILLAATGRHLKSIECHDIMCHVAEGVLAGGIRRSSLICLFDRDDEDMLTSKTPEHFRYPFRDDPGLNPQRAMANNSAVLPRGTTTREEFDRLKEYVRHYGEPGFFWTNNLDYGTNPCGEIGLNPLIETEPDNPKHERDLKLSGFYHGTGVHGYPVMLKAGFAFCNLCEVNVARADDLVAAAKAAAFIGTLQAAYTDITDSVVEEEALLGVGLTGIMDDPSVGLNPKLLREAAEAAVAENRRVAALIGIKPAARVTTVKPSGTASLELGGVGSGIHPHHARRYFRRVTANPMEPIAKFFKEINPHMVEVKPNGDWSLTFCVEAPTGARTVKEMPWREFLDNVFTVYRNWILPGTTERSISTSPGLTHNVSCTVSVPDGEWDAVFDQVWANSHRINAMSFLPQMSDKGIPFMPREEVLSEDEAKWTKLIERYKPVPYDEMVEHQDDTVFEPACSGGTCDAATMPRPSNPA